VQRADRNKLDNKQFLTSLERGVPFLVASAALVAISDFQDDDEAHTKSLICPNRNLHGTPPSKFVRNRFLVGVYKNILHGT